MKVALIYSSKTGNTEELMKILYKLFLESSFNVYLFRYSEFPIENLSDYDGIVIGTYTWGDGDIPYEMKTLYEAFESQDLKRVITGVVGTGDRFYPKFCGAVDEFRDMLFVQTELAVTLKVELSPQKLDMDRLKRFVDILLERLKGKP